MGPHSSVRLKIIVHMPSLGGPSMSSKLSTSLCAYFSCATMFFWKIFVTDHLTSGRTVNSDKFTKMFAKF